MIFLNLLIILTLVASQQLQSGPKTPKLALKEKSHCMFNFYTFIREWLINLAPPLSKMRLVDFDSSENDVDEDDHPNLTFDEYVNKPIPKDTEILPGTCFSLAACRRYFTF